MNTLVKWLGRFALFKYIQSYLFSTALVTLATVLTVFVESELGSYFVLVGMTDAVLYAILVKYLFIAFIFVWYFTYVRKVYRSKVKEELVVEEPVEQPKPEKKLWRFKWATLRNLKQN